MVSGVRSPLSHGARASGQRALLSRCSILLSWQEWLLCAVVRLQADSHVTCAEFYSECIAKLGTDPLREDADPELLWAKMQLQAAETQSSGPMYPDACAEFYSECIAKLGPDPLREDADPELLWAKMQKSRKPVGLFLMDQSAMAGVGNIYRAEILYKVRTGQGYLPAVCRRSVCLSQVQVGSQSNRRRSCPQLPHTAVPSSSCKLLT